MKYRSKVVLTLIVIMITMLTGCSRDTARTIKDPSEMPDIVFMNVVDLSEVVEADEVQTGVTFYDKKGNHYTSFDSYDYSLTIDELFEVYRAEDLEDKFYLHTTCDVNELFENYQKLCQLSKNKELEIIYPEYGPAVEAIRQNWYGLYYDKEGNIQTIRIHARDAWGDHMANDERANEIYEWYIGTFKK